MTLRRLLATALAAMTLAAPTGAPAVEPDEILTDPALEARAREVSRQLRCVVCQSQSIDDSNAPLARDLRLLVRERVVAGDSNEEVIDHVTARYGDYVLLRPRLEGATIALWLTPAILLLAAAAGGVWFLRRKKDEKSPPPLTDEERAALERLEG